MKQSLHFVEISILAPLMEYIRILFSISGVTTEGSDWANPGAPCPEFKVLELGYERVCKVILLSYGYLRGAF